MESCDVPSPWEDDGRELGGVGNMGVSIAGGVVIRNERSVNVRVFPYDDWVKERLTSCVSVGRNDLSRLSQVRMWSSGQTCSPDAAPSSPPWTFAHIGLASADPGAPPDRVDEVHLPNWNASRKSLVVAMAEDDDVDADVDADGGLRPCKTILVGGTPDHDRFASVTCGSAAWSASAM